MFGKGFKAAASCGGPALLVSFLALAGPACSASLVRAGGTDAGHVSASMPPSATPHIGTIVESGNWRYSVRQVDTAKSIDISTSQYFREVLQAKGLFVVVLVQLTNIGNRNFSINDHDFELHDDKGITYDPATLNQYRLVNFRGQQILGDQFPPGVVLTTTLLFDVAPGTNGMVLYLVQAKQPIRLE